MKKVQEFEDCAERLKAVADPDRLQILTCLFSSPKTVGEIADAIGKSAVNVSHHLGILRRSRIVSASKKGRFVQYSVHPDVHMNQRSESDAPKISFGCCSLDLEP